MDATAWQTQMLKYLKICAWTLVLFFCWVIFRDVREFLTPTAAQASVTMQTVGNVQDVRLVAIQQGFPWQTIPVSLH